MLQLPVIPPPNYIIAEEARVRQNRLTKPAGSLGRLEDLSIQLASIQGTLHPDVSRKSVIVMAADHGVAREGVSAYPADVTRQMVMNFLQGGAAINVLARQAGARICVVDMGVAADFPESLPIINARIDHGTRNMAEGPAMTRLQAEETILRGMEIAEREFSRGVDILATGDMGIGNTTPSSAMTAVFTGLPVEQVTGRGTGIDDRGLAAKVAVIQKTIRVNRPDHKDPLDVLAKVGGFEIGGLAGLIIGSAARRVPVVVDGFISSTAALLACEMLPDVRPYLIAAHCSVEIGHRAVLDKIGLEPLLDLRLRLGEGTGAALAFHIIEASVRILNEMATFEDAGVSDRS
ncbi:MAG: nicotinate-nucleotide--dimethylbenzimidazole phosphoribosyltransferase [Leptolinea sp.]|nr:nicotinate-nucleotide--dimethylbenzimidazole phosphoribosyltransferase [Leptolinea sp.]